MRLKEDQKKLLPFIKIGIVVLSFLLLASTLFHYMKDTVSTMAPLHAKELPIYCVETDKPTISLSFDAAWGNEDTAKILDILKKHHVKVTFFMTGGWVEKYPEDVKAIAAAGHDLANHSENHKQMSRLSAEQCKDEILKVHEKVKTLTGKEMILFRPPYGDYNDNLILTTKEVGYYPVQWDVDSLDWRDYDAPTIVNRVCNHKNLKNGSIILCHNGAKHTAEALDEMITTLQSKGYQLVPISKLIIKDHYKMNVDGRQCKE